MKDQLKLITVLTLICAISGLSMSFVYLITKEPIRLAEKRDEENAVKDVLPPHEQISSITLTQEQEVATFFIGSTSNRVIGIATRGKSVNGYGGDINVMVGIASTGTVQSIKVLTPLFETPGLGANIRQAKWRSQFSDKPIDCTWSVRKDNKGNPHAIDSVTAATISSRAVVEAVGKAISKYKRFDNMLQASISSTGEQE